MFHDGFDCDYEDETSAKSTLDFDSSRTSAKSTSDFDSSRTSAKSTSDFDPWDHILDTTWNKTGDTTRSKFSKLGWGERKKQNQDEQVNRKNDLAMEAIDDDAKRHEDAGFYCLMSMILMEQRIVVPNAMLASSSWINTSARTNMFFRA
mmetsp:Transcript_21477/g.26349  ORF Transcript_21477/g.26349 Transcript_21477/m.26349 type:complete len:149 (+) Transcript_21477:368-814(+)